MAFVRLITVDTALLPPVTIDPSAPSSGSGLGQWILKLLRPRITINTEIGTKTIEPWGDPGATRWPEVRDFLIVAVFASFVIFVFTRKG